MSISSHFIINQLLEDESDFHLGKFIFPKHHDLKDFLNNLNNRSKMLIRIYHNDKKLAYYF